MDKVKQKKCKACWEKFSPFKSTDKTCSYDCLRAFEKQKPKKVSTKKEKAVKAKPKKRETISSLKKKLDTIFSRFIRHRDSENWTWQCITCSKDVEFSKAHNCHYIGRGCIRYRYDEENCHLGCAGCNTYNQEFHMRMYTLHMVNKHWLEYVQEMHRLAKQPYKMWMNDLREKIEYYKERVAKFE